MTNCRNCRTPFHGDGVGGAYCSQTCEALHEHEKKLQENEHMSILVRTLDDGGTAVQINLRQLTGIQELAQNYDTLEGALRGISKICTAVADGLENEDAE
jgi:hypothetical protein